MNIIEKEKLNVVKPGILQSQLTENCVPQKTEISFNIVNTGFPLLLFTINIF